MFTTKQRAFLRALANAIEPSMQVGKDGVTENAITTLNAQLEAREIVKIKVLKNLGLETKDVCNQFITALSCEVVQVIGGTFVVYRKSTKKGFRHIELP